MRKVLSLLLSLIMIISAVSVTGITASAENYSGKCGDGLTWILDTATGVMEINGTGAMYDYTSGSAPWYEYGSDIKTLNIGDSVTYIGAHAFYECFGLTEVNISDSVIEIGEWAFEYCVYLENVNIGSSVTTIGYGAFYYCMGLKDITIPKNVTYIGETAFANTDATIHCYKDSCAYEYVMLWNHRYVLLSNKTESGSCGPRLTWTLDTVTGVFTVSGNGAMYNYYENEYYDGVNVTNVPWEKFSNLIKSVVIEDTVTSIGDYTFYWCRSLEDLYIGKAVTSIGEKAFYDCVSLKAIDIPDSVTVVKSDAFGFCTSVTSLKLGKSLTNISNGAFYNLKSLTSVVIPDSVTNIYSSAFASCSSLSSITIPASVKSIDIDTFKDCTSLADITIPDSVTVIRRGAFNNTAYYNDRNNWDNGVLYIGNHLIKGSVNGVYTVEDTTLTIADEAFKDCTSLTGVVIGDWVTAIPDSAFRGCSALTSVVIGDRVAKVDSYAFENCSALSELTIGNAVTEIGYSAFNGCTSLTEVVLPDSIKTIGSSAFYDCHYLTSVTIPASVTGIGYQSFHYYNGTEYSPLDTLIRCYNGSYAYNYAVNNGFAYELICEHSFTDYTSDNNATCTEDGTKTAYCDKGCGAVDVLIDEGSSTGHDWSEWFTTIEPTVNSEGVKMRFCNICFETVETAIPALENLSRPVITVDNFTVTITNAEDIKDMRYAPGMHTTTTEIRNAEGNVALDNSIVVKNTVDGNFVYSMPSGGYYSLWIRMKDGTNHIMSLDLTVINAFVSAYGVKVTVHDIYDVKDIYIAKGEFESYREIKDNGYIVALSASKIGNKRDYTYTVYEPGIHTVLIRYNDGRTALFHEELTVEEPVFTTNGLQVTISNIPDVKVIRTAYGEYYTPGDTKRAAGARNFSNKAVIKNAEEYTLQYREDGIVTIVVEYNNGYVKVFHYEVKGKQATMIQSKTAIVFKDLDGFVMIRYAQGEFATSSEIKRAKGSKVIKPADLTGSYAMITGLKAGTYTFCVQFDDESYDYYTVTV